MASKLRPDFFKRNNIIQPHLIRERHAFRSPRQSERINLGSEQIAFDISNLASRMELYTQNLEENLDIVENGGLVSGNLTVLSLDELIIKVQELKTRLVIIETKEGL